MVLLAALVLSSTPQHIPDVVCFASTAEPSKNERSLLEAGYEAISRGALKLNLVVHRLDHFVFVRPVNLLQLESFAKRLDAIAALSHIAGRQEPIRVDDLTPSQRDGIWEFFKRSAYADVVGPVLQGSGTRLAVMRQDTIIAGDGRTSLRVTPMGKAIGFNEASLPRLDADKKRAYESKKRKEPALDLGNVISFHFITRQGSERNMEAVSKFSKHLEDILKKQNEEYAKARAQLLAAWPGPNLKPGDLLTSDPGFYGDAERDLQNNFRQAGFTSGGDGLAFLQRAKITDVQSDVYIGFMLDIGGRLEGRFISTKISRFR